MEFNSGFKGLNRLKVLRHATFIIAIPQKLQVSVVIGYTIINVCVDGIRPYY